MGPWIALTCVLVVASVAVLRTAFLLDARAKDLSRSASAWGDLARSLSSTARTAIPDGADARRLERLTVRRRGASTR